jgi:translation initiation factor 1
MRRATDGLVYSTEQGRLCPVCGAAVAQCRCGQNGPATTGDGIVRVGRETKGRKGGGVTVITGLPRERLSDLCTQLKKRCGCGGTVKDATIEIQGDQRDLLVSLLTAQGFIVKRVGG